MRSQYSSKRLKTGEMYTCSTHPCCYVVFIIGIDQTHDEIHYIIFNLKTGNCQGIFITGNTATKQELYAFVDEELIN